MAQLSLSSSFSYAFTYDVFLNFRGSDTRFRFTGHLYKALCDCGIHAFIDDRELHGGDEITPSLVKAIEDSRIFIPVFSANYASSSFCLDELVHIIHCFKTKGRLVLPVFYDVDPSQVRHQTGSYGEAIAKHKERFQNNNGKENMERLKKWKMALSQAANLSGYHFNVGNEYEYEIIGKIIKNVSDKICRAPLHVADYPVGLESRLLQVNSLLNVDYNDEVRMVGIYGTGGMGKTTLARAVYNLIADQFEGLCFLHNVRENSAKYGLEHLQEQLLSKTIGLNVKLGDVNEGIPLIRKRLPRRKILLILDDVDELKQLQVMAGGLDWFGLGSRVIITTRDKNLLDLHGIEKSYEAGVLNDKESLELLRWKAFKKNKVDSSFDHILSRAVTYASGLPLAIEVVGSNLFGKHIEEWKSTLDWYERIPDKKIQEILKVSFNALGDYEQSVFLDIACCFKGYEVTEVEDILHAHYGDDMKHIIQVLVEKSLLKISELSYTYVTLHDLIEDMGKEIVRQESPKYPGKRSRLWFHKDIVHVLEENSGTNEIEVIHLHSTLIEAVVNWNGNAFKNMKNLKTLIIKSGHFSEGPRHFPSNLRVLEWQRYPSQYIPPNFHPKKLAICKLPNSYLTSSELASFLDKPLVHLKVLNFDNCKYVTHIPDVSALNLEEFSFEYCENLITIHSSVGFLSKLKILKAKGCSKLESFPPLKLTSLQELELSRCDSLMKFPEILGKMENITEISLFETFIEELPISFQNFTGLHKLLIFGYDPKLRLPISILMMPTLSCIDATGCIFTKHNDKHSSMKSSKVDRLQLTNCNLPDGFLPTLLSWFPNVTYLELQRNDFTILPQCIKNFCFLSTLILDDCKNLREVRGIPPNLKWLSASNCKSLTSSCRSMLMNQELHEAGGTMFCLPGTARVPKWFEHQSKGTSISFWFRNNIPSIALFVASKSNHPDSALLLTSTVGLIINGYKIDLRRPFDGLRQLMQLDHTYLFDLHLQDMELSWTLGMSLEEYQEQKSKLDKALLKNEWNHAEITCENEETIPLLIETGIHLFKQNNRMEDIQFTHPNKK